MSRKERDFQAEYRRRIERAATRGLSRSQARGHPKATEGHVSRKPAKPLESERLQFGLRSLGRGKSLAETARELRVSPERLRHHLSSLNVTEKRGRRWVVKDDLQRTVQVYSDGRSKVITVPNHKAARFVAGFMSQVNLALNHNDPGFVNFYDGMSVTDVHGISHPLETDLNALYRLDVSRSETFEQIYRIVV